MLNPSKLLDFFSTLSDVKCAKFEYVLGHECPSAIRRTDRSSEVDEEFLVGEKKWELFKSERKFSPDSVIVEITDADIDITFIDLPGLN